MACGPRDSVAGALALPAWGGNAPVACRPIPARPAVVLAVNRQAIGSLSCLDLPGIRWWRHSDAIAASMLSLAARRAGATDATTPASTAAAANSTSCAAGTVTVGCCERVTA